MTALIYTTVGTETYWGPPRLARFDVDNDFVISNTDLLEWQIEGKGWVVRAAIYVGDAWHAMSLETPQRVRKRDTLCCPPGSIRIRTLSSDAPGMSQLPAPGLLPPPPDLPALGQIRGDS